MMSMFDFTNEIFNIESIPEFSMHFHSKQKKMKIQAKGMDKHKAKTSINRVAILHTLQGIIMAKRESEKRKQASGDNGNVRNSLLTK